MPSARSRSPASSASSSYNRSPSPEGEPDPDDSVTCSWGTCGEVFTHLPTFIAHLHDTHIGAHKSSYTCEWSSCNRRGLPQTSRFALVSHLRSHTGERPFECRLPECDKAFARQDALQKHLKIQHNMTLPSLRVTKKKQGAAAETPPPNGQGTFKVNQDGGTAQEEDTQVQESPVPSPIQAMNVDNNNDENDTLPDHLLAKVDSNGLIHGRTEAMAMYLIMKAKHQHALSQHAMLVEQLSVVRQDLIREKEEKEKALDVMLGAVFGEEAAMQVDRNPPYPRSNGHARRKQNVHVNPPAEPPVDLEELQRVDGVLDGLFGPMPPPATPAMGNGRS